MICRTGRKVPWMAALAVAILASSIPVNSEGKKETELNPRAVQREAFTVVGVAVRTSNTKEMTAERPIGKQWERWMGKGLARKIPNRADGNIVALYTDYATDQHGEYTYLLGAGVSKVESLREGMTAKYVPAGRYAVFTSERGPVEKVVVEMWQRVWETPKSALGGDRACRTDFEVYDQRAENPADAVADLYVAVR